MNRRQFLVGVMLAPVVAMVKPTPIPGTWGAVVRSKTPMWRATMHPSQYEAYKGLLEIVNDGTISGQYLGLRR